MVSSRCAVNFKPGLEELFAPLVEAAADPHRNTLLYLEVIILVIGGVVCGGHEPELG